MGRAARDPKTNCELCLERSPSDGAQAWLLLLLRGCDADFCSYCFPDFLETSNFFAFELDNQGTLFLSIKIIPRFSSSRRKTFSFF